MSDKKIKSALDLAMERLDAASGAVPIVSASARKEIADIEKKAVAKIAEMEIMHQSNLAKAKGKYREIRELDAAMQAAVKKTREGAEEDKQVVRDRER